jgi:NADH-quinone oxidoreductase subunit L
MGARLQDGDAGKYAWLLAAGAVALIAALTLS